MVEGNGGALTSQERFARLEREMAVLERDLQDKIDREEWHRLVRIHNEHFGDRLRVLESGAAPVSQLLREEFLDVRNQVRDLTEQGSANAREALADSRKLAEDVRQLQNDFERRQGEREADGLRNRQWTLAIFAFQMFITAGNLLITTHLIH